MTKSEKSIKLSIVLTDIFILLLIIGAIALPWLVTWYVELRHRSADLPTIVMLTCYPCAPFAAAILIQLRQVLKNLLQGSVFTAINTAKLRNISFCCFAVTFVMLISGRFYLPFYVFAACMAFIGLIMRIIHSILQNGIEEDTDK